MPGIYDRLQQAIEVSKRDEGISPIEIAELPPNLRDVVRLMLREGVMKYNNLYLVMASDQPGNCMSPAELDAALVELVEQNWITRYGSGKSASYRVNLHRRTASRLNKDIWSALDGRISDQQTDHADMPE
jgi:hypothetical protein